MKDLKLLNNFTSSIKDTTSVWFLILILCQKTSIIDNLITAPYFSCVCAYRERYLPSVIENVLYTVAMKLRSRLKLPYSQCIMAASEQYFGAVDESCACSSFLLCTERDARLQSCGSHPLHISHVQGTVLLLFVVVLLLLASPLSVRKPSDSRTIILLLTVLWKVRNRRHT